MEFIMNALNSWLVMGALFLVLVGLIVFLLVMRNRREDED
jgi:hypothetical protein